MRNPSEGEVRFLALLKSGRRKATVIGPDLALHHLEPTLIQSALSYPSAAPFLAEIEALLTKLALPSHRRPQAQNALLRERLRQTQIHGG